MLRELGVIAGQQVRAAMEERHLRAQASERLRHLDTDWAAPQDDQPFRDLLQIEDRLVGEIAGLNEAGDVRVQRAASRWPG